MTVRNGVVKGEYLAWYSGRLTLESGKITVPEVGEVIMADQQAKGEIVILN